MSVFLAVAVSPVVREGAVAWSRSATGADNEDATPDSITCSYVLIYVSVIGVLLGCRRLFGLKQLRSLHFSCRNDIYAVLIRFDAW